MNGLKSVVYIVSLCSIIFSCKSKKDAEETESGSDSGAVELVKAPEFLGDSAYYFVEKQVSFGPRVPNTSAHVKTGNWIVSKMKQYGFAVTEQTFSPSTYDAKVLKAKNIIASYNPQATKRILLAAHWDSRPFADKDDERKTEAILGANDGASGVGVLIEFARIIATASNKPAVGIDIVFFDAEDWGAPESFTGTANNDYGGYCLGSDYWSKNPHIPNYTAFYGILLDMVGAPNASFRKEAGSMQVAPNVVQNVWSTAKTIGFGQYFIDEEGAGLSDDHIPVIKNLKIPMIDIIHLTPVTNPKTFFDAHHTHDDTMKVIDKNTLKAVGQTLLQVIYQE
jgi:glutaminyl-peptide cyclotransferase